VVSWNVRRVRLIKNSDNSCKTASGDISNATGYKGGIMKMRCVRLGSALLLSATMAFGPAVQAADQGVTYLARAIGEESPPTAPKPKQPPKPGTPAKAAATPKQPPKESTGMSTKTKVWIGVGVAAALAAAAGGGGGSSGGFIPPHVP